MMDKLSNKVATLIRSGVSTLGSYDLDEIMPYIEEELTPAEYDQAEAFLVWVTTFDKTFGHNIHEVYAEFAKSTGIPSTPDSTETGEVVVEVKEGNFLYLVHGNLEGSNDVTLRLVEASNPEAASEIATNNVEKLYYKAYNIVAVIKFTSDMVLRP